MSTPNIEKQTKEYLEKNKIEKMVTDMLNSLIHSKDEKDKPIIYLMKYLAMMVPEEELSANGISVAGPFPRRYPSLILNDFPQISDAIVKKYFQDSIWKDFRPKKTKFEGRIAHCIHSFFENEKEKIGLYACDSESYSLFAPLFSPVIKEIHDIEINPRLMFKHNYDIQDLHWIKSLQLLSCIKQLTISIRRNLEEFPFLPLLDVSTKRSIEAKVCSHLIERNESRFELSKLNATDKKILMDEGIIIERSPCVELIIPTAKTHEGTFVYFNQSKPSIYITICNEDHVNIIVNEKENIDMMESFSKAFARLKKLEQNLPISENQTMGSLTVSPCYLGTGMIIKVEIQFNKLSSNISENDDIKKKCLQNGFILRYKGNKKYELSNYRTIGRPENEIIASFLDCLTKILNEEERIIKLEEENEKIAIKKKKIIPNLNNCTCLISRVLNPEKINYYSDVQTKFGNTFFDCLQAASHNHGCGLIAFDEDCYNKYDHIFTDVSRNLHNDFGPINPTDLDIEAFNQTHIKTDEIKNISSGYFLWQVNLKEFEFPPSLTKDKRIQVNSRILYIFDTIIKLFNLEPKPISLLNDMNYLKSNSGLNDLLNERSKLDCCFGENWPEGRLLYENSDVCFITNILNHVALIIKISTGVDKSIATFIKCYKILMQNNLLNNFSYNEKFGFMNSLLENIGHSFSLKFFLKLVNNSFANKLVNTAIQTTLNATIENGLIILSNRMKFRPVHICIRDALETARALFSKENELSSDNNSSNSLILSESMRKETSKLFPANYLGLAREFLTEYEMNKFKKSNNGSEIKKLYNSVIENLEDSVGLFIDEELFATLRDIYMPALLRIHPKLQINKNRHSPLSLINVKTLHPSIKGYIEVSRNFKKIRMPAFGEKSDRISVYKIFLSNIEEIKTSVNGSLIGLNKEIAKEICSKVEFNDEIEKAENSQKGIYSDWPYDRYVFESDSKTFYILVNGRNHIRLLSYFSNGNLNESYNLLVKVLQILDNSIGFSYDASVGYLCTDLGDMESCSLKAIANINENLLLMEKIQNNPEEYSMSKEKIIGCRMKYKIELSESDNIEVWWERLSESLI